MVTPHLIELETGAFRFGPVDRARLVRLLELPGPEDLDPVTQQEVDRLDAMRDELLCFWRRAVALAIHRVGDDWIELAGGFRLRSVRSYCRQLLADEADHLVVTTFTMGGQVDAKVKHHLEHRELFEAFVLNQWAAVMTEQARVWLTRSLCGWADRHHRSLLPYNGPGYNGWPLDAIPSLLRLVACDGRGDRDAGVRAVDSGLLQPLHSMLIVYGATPRRKRTSRAEDLAQCHRCAMRNCRYRVAPLDRSPAAELAGVAP